MVYPSNVISLTSFTLLFQPEVLVLETYLSKISAVMKESLRAVISGTMYFEWISDKVDYVAVRS
jgi:hypothetical protein